MMKGFKSSGKGYEKFCEGCMRCTPESMKDFIADGAGFEEIVYYCYWCDFICATGIDDIVVRKQEELAKSTKDSSYQEEDDGYVAMWDLEDGGAFSDEGIMAGCHSGWDTMMSEFDEIDANNKFTGVLLKAAREKAHILTAELAERLKLSESDILYLEAGEYTAWCDEIGLDRITEYLSYVINPPVDGKHAPCDYQKRVYASERVKNVFVDSVENLLKNEELTMGMLQWAFKIGVRPAYKIMNILYECGVVHTFPEKDKPVAAELDEDTIWAFQQAGWTQEEIESLKGSDNLLELYDKIDELQKKHGVKVQSEQPNAPF